MLEARPIVIDKDGTVLGGNMRLKAAQLAGLDEVPVYVREWDEGKDGQFIIKDNVSFGEWDQDMLGNEWEPEQLDEWGLNIDWDEPEETEGLTDADDVPEVPEEATTKPGDLWVLGEHRLLCGDSTKAEDVERLMDGNKADMAFTDPPYNVEYTGGIQYKNGKKVTNNREMIANDDRDLYPEVVGILCDYVDGPSYVWFAGTKASTLYATAEELADIHSLIIWVKNGGYGALGASYKQKHEPCLFIKTKGSTLRFVGPTTENTVWEIDKDGVNRLHPTQKPVELAERALKNHDAKNVLDLFLGSGSTLIAAEKTNRICYGMELDPKYCDVIVKRWEEFTGKKAHLQNDEEEFEILTQAN
tara:strand:+ start:1089 stop:2165 length:1077 start_codon:yes stop_codon:yes gene_type:complete